MSQHLAISIGQCSSAGRKPVNQDFHGAVVPPEPLLSAKGIAVAIADGISSSDLSQIASETAVKALLEDYYATSEAWCVKTSVQRVLRATNSWLYAQTRNGPHRYTLDRGYVCTLSAVVLKSTTVHIFHVGDTRVCYLAGRRLEQLTEDHRLHLSRDQSYLARALGMSDRLEIDYQAYPLEVGDTFVLMSDGVYEFADESVIAGAIEQHRDDLDQACRIIVEAALARGSGDNLSIQILRVDQLPQGALDELNQHASALPFPPQLRPRMQLDGFEILRELHGSSRSHVYLARDTQTGEQVVLKAPSVDLRGDADYLERFLMEEWIARRVDSVHVLKAAAQTRKRHSLYIVTEYVEGRTLAQWMRDHPRPDLETVRTLVEQIARGLQALHRQEMLHQDLRPDNVMIDRAGTVKLIDFGSVRVAGVAELAGPGERRRILGTAQYTAPEYFLGEPGSHRSDLFSLGVIAYQMLSGRLPYGTGVAKATTRAAQRRLVYRSVLDDERGVPAWIDGALRKAVHPNPARRHDEISEFLDDLRHPSPALLSGDRPPLIERNPLLFWQGLSLLLLAVVVLLSTHPVLTQARGASSNLASQLGEPIHEQARND